MAAYSHELNILFAESYWPRVEMVRRQGDSDPRARFEQFFSSPSNRLVGGPATTVRNVVRAFSALGRPFALNDLRYHRYETNLLLLLPGISWRKSQLSRILFDPSIDTSRFFFHSLVEVRQIYDQLQAEGGSSDELEILVRQCRRAQHLAESPKQYFRMKNNVRPLYERLHLAPVGFADDLEALLPYWARDEVVLFVKDHNHVYNVDERAQHLADLLDTKGISYARFECHSGRTFDHAAYLEQLARSRFMVAWDVEETLGHAVLEARAMGVPIFTTTPNGMNYFDERSGVIALENELHERFDEFLQLLRQRAFRPRQWLLEVGLDGVSTAENLSQIFQGRPSRFSPYERVGALKKG